MGVYNEEIGMIKPIYNIIHLSTENGAECDSDSDGEMVHDYDVDTTANGSLQNTDRLPVPVLEAIKTHGLVEKLWQRAQPIAENVLDILAINDVTLPKK